MCKRVIHIEEYYIYERERRHHTGFYLFNPLALRGGQSAGFMLRNIERGA